MSIVSYIYEIITIYVQQINEIFSYLGTIGGGCMLLCIIIRRTLIAET